MSEKKDLVVKMTINSTDFNKGLKNAKSEMKKTEILSSDAAKSMKKSFGKVAVAIAGASTVLEGFDQLIRSTEEGADGLDKALHVAKTTVNQFFHALSTGSFDSFIRGLDDITKNAKAAYDALDALGTTKMWGTAEISNLQAKIAEDKVIVNNKKASEEERKSAQARIDANTKEIENITGRILDKTQTSMKTTLREMAGAGSLVSEEMLESFRKMFQDETLGAEAEKFYAEHAKKGIKAIDVSEFQTGSDVIEKEIDIFDSEQNRQIYSAMKNLSTINEEQWNAYYELMEGESALRSDLASQMSKATLLLNKDIGGGSGGSGGGGKSAKESSASLAKDTTGRWGKGNIDLNNRKVVVNDDGSISTELSFSENIDGLEVLLPTVIDGMIVSFDEAVEHYFKTGEHLGKFNTPQEAEEYAEMLHNRQDWYYNTYLKDPNNLAMVMMERQMQRVPVPLLPYQELGLPEEDIIEPDTDMLVESVTKKMAELVKQTNEAFLAADSLGNAFNAIGSVAGDNTFGRIANGIGGMISQASTATKALMVLAGAETVEGIAETFSKVPPFLKIAMTATALAGILGMIASAKSAFAGSFADGGVVGGNSFTGDKLWARVNSGEMILNRSQQASLMNVGNVKFVIEGSQLKGVLDNYNSLNNM